MGNVHASSSVPPPSMGLVPPPPVNLSPPPEVDIKPKPTNVNNPGTMEDLHKKCKGRHFSYSIDKI